MQKRKISELTSTSITTMKIKVKFKLANHIYRRNIVSFVSPNCQKVSIQLAHTDWPSTAYQGYAIEMAYCWRAVGGPTRCALWAGNFSFISAVTYDLGVKKNRLDERVLSSIQA